MNKYIAILWILIFSVTKVYAEEQSKKFGHGKVVFTKQNLTVKVEIAKTKTQRTMGLMFRETLARDRGMLFVYEEEKILKVWMKKTLIPLDIIFVSAQGKVVSIIKRLQPCLLEPCDIYASTKNAKYMLEVNAGMIESKGISVGQLLIFYEII